jgi:hypothetical protein
MSTACGEELQLLIRSGWNLIAFETSEEDRALALLRRIAQATERRCITWTLASGLDAREIDSPLKDRQGKLAEGSSSGSLNEGVIGISAYEEPAVFVVLDAHRLLDDPMAIRRLRDRLPQCAARRQVVVLLGPLLHLPVELLREAAIVELPLPNEAELLSLFERLHDQRADAQPKSAHSGKPLLTAAARRRCACFARRAQNREDSTTTRSKRSCARSAARSDAHPR